MMLYKLIPDSAGNYVDEDGTRFVVSVVRRVRNAQGLNVGYEEFPSLEAALEHWGLVRVPPEAPPTDEQIS